MDRCVKCIMPVTAQGVDFDADGLCTLCRGFREYVPRGETALREEIAPQVRGKGDFDCIVPLSGGRDSSYALYFAKRVLGLKPIAVHNDNDFETEIARRNLDAVTRRLDTPLVRVGTKRKLARTIVAEKIAMNAPYGAPLVVEQICEACQIGFESAAYNVARRNGISLVIWADSKDESTSSYHRLIHHRVPTTLQRLLTRQARHLFAYKYYSRLMQREYGPHSPYGLREIHLYDYIRWDQKVIVDTIQNETGWSVPDDSPTTWRIDCSLVPLVNYLTAKAYGVSKIELGFGNMVRAGKMDRDDALQRVEQIRVNTDVNALRQLLTGMGIDGATAGRVLDPREKPRVSWQPVKALLRMMSDLRFLEKGH